MKGEFRLNLKDAMKISQTRDISRRCKSCNKPFLISAKLGGTVVECPECHTKHIVTYVVKFDIAIELDEATA